MKKPLLNRYDYYPQEFQSLTEEQLLMVEDYLRQQDIRRDKEIAMLKAQHRRERNGHFFAVVPTTLILVAFSQELISNLWWSLLGVVCVCAFAIVAHTIAQSAYTNFIEKQDTKKSALILKTIGCIIVSLCIALLVNNYFY